MEVLQALFKRKNPRSVPTFHQVFTGEPCKVPEWRGRTGGSSSDTGARLEHSAGPAGCVRSPLPAALCFSTCNSAASSEAGSGGSPAQPAGTKPEDLAGEGWAGLVWSQTMAWAGHRWLGSFLSLLL